MATDQQEQWNNMHATLAELQGKQPSLDQQLHEASEVCAVHHANVIRTYIKASLA